MPFDPRNTPLSAIEARVLATLMEKARTVPDSYPLTLNSLVTGCNQKSSREPVTDYDDRTLQDAVRALKPGEAAAVQYSGYALMHLVRLDPLEADTLDALRAQALSDMKSGELQDSLQSYGAQLPHALDSAAMKKMPASKIKNEQ